jgi:NAD(P)-dependent dehydrogenase (short-subunit alcohol dehydrogenase family)
MAIKFAEEGCSIAIADISIKEANDTCTEVKKRGVDGLVIECDVTNGKQVQETVDKVYKKFGKIDILVNNAGSAKVGPFAKIELEGQVSLLHVQTVAPVILARTALPGMTARKRGWLIFTASLSAFMPAPGSGVYIPAKAFLVALTRVLEPELRLSGVRVQALCPVPVPIEQDAPALVRLLFAPAEPPTAVAATLGVQVNEGFNRIDGAARITLSVALTPETLQPTIRVDTRQMMGPGAPGQPERHENVSVEVGAAVNPPGFDEQLIDLLLFHRVMG